MEPEELKLIQKNRVALIKTTKCTILLFDSLIESDVMTDEEKSKFVQLKLREGETDQASLFYDIVKVKKNAFNKVVEALDEAGLTGASDILRPLYTPSAVDSSQSATAQNVSGPSQSTQGRLHQDNNPSGSNAGQEIGIASNFNLSKMDWQQSHIYNNIDVLACNTSYAPGLLKQLQEAGVLTDEEFNRLVAKEEAEWKLSQSKLLYQTLLTKACGFDKLIPALIGSQQMMAAQILDGANLFVRTKSGYVEHFDTKPQLDFLHVLRANPTIVDFVNDRTPLTVFVEKPRNAGKLVDQYKLPSKNKGFVLLINIIAFDNPKLEQRVGANLDEYYMATVWTGLGYTVYTSSIVNRGHAEKWTKQEINALIRQFKFDCAAKKPASIIVFVGSHGGWDTICTSDPADPRDPDRLVTLNLFRDIVSQFSHENCPILIDKPKIFLVNTCQDYMESWEKSDNVHRPPYSDAMICISQVPGHPSKRLPGKGSRFPYCLTYVLMKYAKEKSFQEMMYMVKVMMLNIKGANAPTQLPTTTDYFLDTLYFPLDP